MDPIFQHIPFFYGFRPTIFLGNLPRTVSFPIIIIIRPPIFLGNMSLTVQCTVSFPIIIIIIIRPVCILNLWAFSMLTFLHSFVKKLWLTNVTH